MKLGRFFTKPARLLFKRCPTANSRLFVRNFFRKWCIDQELLIKTSEGFQMFASPHGYTSYGIYFFDSYDPFMSWFMKTHVVEGSVCMDIGTDGGWFSLLLGMLVGNKGRVDAFEAYPPNYHKLLKNLAINKYYWVYPHNIAITDRVNRMYFLEPSEEITHNVSFLTDHSGVGYVTEKNLPGTIEVETTTIDEHFQNAALEKLNLIKIDVEGAETAAINGARNTLLAFRPIIIIEYNRETAKRAGSSIEEMDELIASLDYERYTFLGKLKKLDLTLWNEKSDNEAVFNVYCFPKEDIR